MKKLHFLLTVLLLLIGVKGYSQRDVDMLVDSIYFFSFSTPVDSSVTLKKTYGYTDFDSLSVYKLYYKTSSGWDYRAKQEWQYYDDLRLKKFINTDVGEYVDIQTYTYTDDYVSRIDRSFAYVSDPFQASGFTEFDSLGRQRLDKFRWSDEWRGYEINSEHDYDELNRLYHYYYDKYSWTPNSGFNETKRKEYEYDEHGNLIAAANFEDTETGFNRKYYFYTYVNDTLKKKLRYSDSFQWPYIPSDDNLIDSSHYYYDGNQTSQYIFQYITSLGHWDSCWRIVETSLDTFGSYSREQYLKDHASSIWILNSLVEVQYDDINNYDSSYLAYRSDGSMWYMLCNRIKYFYNPELDSSSITRYVRNPTVMDWIPYSRNIRKITETQNPGLDYMNQSWNEEYSTMDESWILTSYYSDREIFNEFGNKIRRIKKDLSKIEDYYIIYDEWERRLRVEKYLAEMPDTTRRLIRKEHYYYSDYGSGIGDGGTENTLLWFNNSDETIHHPAITNSGFFSVFDLSGRVMTDGILAKESTSFNVSGLQPGTYIAAVFDGKKKYSLKFFIR